MEEAESKELLKKYLQHLKQIKMYKKDLELIDKEKQAMDREKQVAMERFKQRIREY